MVIVVKTFAECQQCQPLKICGPIFVRASSEVVTQCVHRCVRCQVIVHMDNCCKQSDEWPEHDNKNRDAKSKAGFVVSKEEPVPYVIW